MHVPIVAAGKFLEDAEVAVPAEKIMDFLPVLRVIVLHGDQLDLEAGEIEVGQNLVFASLGIDGKIIDDLRRVMFL